MKPKGPKLRARDSAREIAELRARLAEAEETLEAIRSGTVDALVVSGPEGDQVFALKGAETPYRLLVESMHEAAMMLNGEGTILYCNGRLAALTGCLSGYPVGRALADFIMPEQAATLKQLFSEVPAGGRQAEFWLRPFDGSGKPVPIQLTARPLHLEGTDALAVVATDLTTQKAYEAMLHQSKDELEARVRERTSELRAQREYFRVTLTSIGDAVMAFDTLGRATFVNPVAVTLTGWTEEQALGKPVADLFRIIDEKTRQPGEDIVARALQQKRVVMLADGKALIARSGREIPIEDSAAPIFDTSGSVTGAVLVFHEVTEKRRAMEALRQSEERFKLSMEATSDGLWDWDAKTDRVYYSPSYYRILGYEPGGFPGTLQAWKERVHPDDVEHTVQVNMDCVEGRSESFSVEYRMKARTGDWRWILGRGRCITRGESGRATRLIGTHVDITHRKQFEAELERLVAERTAKSQEMIDELQHVSYSIVHDMRAPLRAMHGLTNMLEEQCASCPRNQNLEYFRRIRTASARMDRLITDALQYTEAVLQQLPIQPTDLSALLRGLLETYPNLHPDRADISIEGNLPVVLGNEALLTQCFSNLLANAVKFVPPGVKPRVRIWAEPMEDTGRRRRGDAETTSLSSPSDLSAPAPLSLRASLVRIWAADNGIGIPKLAQARLFGMFQRVAVGYEGTGIGLAIVRKVVERMGGTVGVESEPGKGSRFWVSLRTPQ